MTEEYTAFFIGGFGHTKELACTDFADNFSKQFPNSPGTYSLIIRAPLTYTSAHDQDKHVLRLRGAYKLIDENIFEVSK